jgi:hypothetical protein
LESGDASPLSIPCIDLPMKVMEELKATMHRRTPRLPDLPIVLSNSELAGIGF